MFVFIHSLSSILAEKSSSKLRFDEKEFLKSSMSSQTWDRDVFGSKNFGSLAVQK